MPGDFIPNRPLQNLGAGDARALGLKVLAQEAMGEFARNLVMGNHAMTKTAMMATSEQFPIIGRAQLERHVPGQQLDGTIIQSAERTISLEDNVVSHYHIPNIDKALKSWEARSVYNRAITILMANHYEEELSRTVYQTAEETSTIPGPEGHGDGIVEVNAAFDNDGMAIFNGIFDVATRLRIQDVPVMGTHAYLDPIRYALVLRSERAINRDINIANGDLASGSFSRINNIPVYETNNLAQSDDTNDMTIAPARRQDYSRFRGGIWHMDAVGILKANEINIQAEDELRSLGTLLVGQMLFGMGTLRPEAAGALAIA